MRNPTFLWIIVGIMLVLEIYVFQAVKMVLPVTSPRLRYTVIIIYWLICVLMLGTLFALPYLNYESWPKGIRTYVTAIIVGAFFSLPCSFVVRKVEHCFQYAGNASVVFRCYENNFTCRKKLLFFHEAIFRCRAGEVHTFKRNYFGWNISFCKRIVVLVSDSACVTIPSVCS